MHLCKHLTRFQSQETIETESNFCVFSLGSVTNQQLFVSIDIVSLPLMQKKTSLNYSDSAQAKQWGGWVTGFTDFRPGVLLSDKQNGKC